MDRALNPERLAEALGQHRPGVLPTVEELTGLIAEIEVRTFIEPTSVDEELLRTAWYLHAVASADQATDLYTPSRQERAFAVSGHIFDLALNGPGRSPHDQVTLAFAAQVGYRRGDLEPNATAIWRRVDRHLDGPLVTYTEGFATDDSLTNELESNGLANVDSELSAYSTLSRSLGTLALRAGVVFLGLEVRRIQYLLGNVARGNLDDAHSARPRQPRNYDVWSRGGHSCGRWRSHGVSSAMAIVIG